MASTSRRHSGHARRPVPRSHTRLAHPAARKPSTVNVHSPIFHSRVHPLRFPAKTKFRTPGHQVVDSNVYEGGITFDALLRISANVEIQGKLSVRTDKPV